MRTPSFRLILPALVLLTAGTLSAQAAVETYKIDAVHSNISFKIRHLMSKVQGRFGKAEGVVALDTKDITKSSVDVSIDTNSISTNDEKRDGHLKTPDFFDVAKYPTITFKSTKVKETSKGHLEVTGVFTMHGVARNLVLPITFLGTQTDPYKNVVAGFEGGTTLNRTNFDMGYAPGLLGNDVEIDLNIEARKQ